MEMIVSEQETSISFFLKRNKIVLSLTYTHAEWKERCVWSQQPSKQLGREQSTTFKRMTEPLRTQQKLVRIN